MASIKIVMVEPEIPGNTGNIIRLCANTGTELHLIGPLGFFLDNREMIRAGLDYKEFCSLRKYVDWKEFWTKESPNIGSMLCIYDQDQKISLRDKKT